MHARASGGGGPVNCVIPSAGRDPHRSATGLSSTNVKIPRRARDDRWRVLASAALIVALTGCDRGIDAVRDRLVGRSRATIDSLSAQNAALQRQMVVFERISAEKDTLLREVRDAHILIEAVAEALRRMDGSPSQLESVDSATMAMGGSDSVVAAAG